MLRGHCVALLPSPFRRVFVCLSCNGLIRRSGLGDPSVSCRRFCFLSVEAAWVARRNVALPRGDLGPDAFRPSPRVFTVQLPLPWPPGGGEEGLTLASHVVRGFDDLSGSRGILDACPWTSCEGESTTCSDTPLSPRKKKKKERFRKRADEIRRDSACLFFRCARYLP